MADPIYQPAYIYKITNTINGKFYIGKTVNSIERRFARHVYDAGTNSSCHFHRAIRKYGVDVFLIDILETTTAKEANNKERKWISNLQPEYNMTEGGDGMHGLKRTPEHNAKISAALMGRKRTPEQKAHQSLVMKGRRITQEQISKLRRALTGKKKTPEHIAKIAAAGRGRRHTSESKAKMSAAAYARRLNTSV